MNVCPECSLVPRFWSERSLLLTSTFLRECLSDCPVAEAALGSMQCIPETSTKYTSDVQSTTNLTQKCRKILQKGSAMQLSLCQRRSNKAGPTYMRLSWWHIWSTSMSFHACACLCACVRACAGIHRSSGCLVPFLFYACILQFILVALLADQCVWNSPKGLTVREPTSPIALAACSPLRETNVMNLCKAAAEKSDKSPKAAWSRCWGIVAGDSRKGLQANVLNYQAAESPEAFLTRSLDSCPRINSLFRSQADSCHGALALMYGTCQWCLLSDAWIAIVIILEVMRAQRTHKYFRRDYAYSFLTRHMQWTRTIFTKYASNCHTMKTYCLHKICKYLFVNSYDKYVSTFLRITAQNVQMVSFYVRLSNSKTAFRKDIDEVPRIVVDITNKREKSLLRNHTWRAQDAL